MIEDMNARKLGKHSQRSHIHSCKRFAAFLKRSPETATPDDIRRFQLHLIESGLSICNRNRIMTGVKFLVRVTLRRLDLAAEIYHLQRAAEDPAGDEPGETRRLFGRRHVASRFACCSGSAYGCGLRAGEVVRLRGQAHRQGAEHHSRRAVEGPKDRNVMLSPEMLDLLRQWWKVRPTRWDASVPPQERWLFPGRKPGRPMTTRQLNRLFHETADGARIRKRVCLHSLRHGFATHLLERGADIRIIQALLGHEKLDTTARYTRVATGMIANIKSPLDLLSQPRKKPKKNPGKKPDIGENEQPPA